MIRQRLLKWTHSRRSLVAHLKEWTWRLVGVLELVGIWFNVAEPAIASPRPSMTGCVNSVGDFIGSECVVAQAPDAVLQETPLIPKQRIAQEIATRPLESPVGLFNLFIIFFVTLGPLKIIPPFVRLTQNANQTLRRQLAFYSAAISTVAILLVALVGQNILTVWQIRLPALMIAGGILLFLVALQIVMSQYAPTTKAESPEAPSLSLAVTPLAFPTIVPPFGIAIALTLMVLSRQLGLNPVTILGLLLLVMGLNLVCLLAARPILSFLKPVTLMILGFILGVMQLALGIELIISGIEIEVLVLQRLLGS